MSRLTLSDADKASREWFVGTTQKLSCKTFVDQMGNIFAIRPGLNNSKPATFAGSHLDTQPTGGRFDGILGVCAGVEMLKILEENWIETEGPVGVVNWTNEEGARFPLSMMGSGVWAGQFPLEKAHQMLEVSNPPGARKSVKEELQRIGFLGPIESNWKSGINMGGHFELHIEQGPILGSSKANIGIVEGAQAYKWLTLTFTGRDCHTGTTSYEHRADALYNAARFITQIPEIAKRKGGLGSVGRITAEPGSVNTVPGFVKMSLDIRHHDDHILGEMLTDLRNCLTSIEEQSHADGRPGVKIQIQEDFKSKAVKFQPEAVDCVDAAAQSILGGNSSNSSIVKRKFNEKIRRITSGAGHDSVFVSTRCPTAMIFVPCKNGVSHHPEEWCEKEDCAIGASVLLGAVLRFDKKRSEQWSFCLEGEMGP